MRKGGALRAGVLVGACALRGERGVADRQQRRRERDPSVRDREEGVDVQRQSARGDGEREPVLPDRDGEGERARAVPLPVLVVRAAAEHAGGRADGARSVERAGVVNPSMP